MLGPTLLSAISVLVRLVDLLMILGDSSFGHAGVLVMQAVIY